MRSWLPLTLLMLAIPAGAALPGDTPRDSKPLRGMSAAAATPSDRLEARLAGAETFATALPVISVPFSDAGSTLGHGDDFLECYAGGGTGAPDVVYAFVPPASGLYTFDLCGSAFDTKMYLFDQSRTLVACNDDFDPTYGEGEPCFLNARLERFAADMGDTVFVVVDGYADLAGDYTLSITAADACEPVVPSPVLVEGEPALFTGQVDEFNCGCVCAGSAVYQRLNGDGSGQGSIALRIGWRDFGVRDHDWIELVSGSTGEIHVEFEAEVPARVIVWNVADCEFGEFESYAVNACEPFSLDTTVMGRANFLIVVTATGPYPPHGLVPVESDAVLTVSGLDMTTATEVTSWGHLKGMFR
ncbi:hypothetical protein FJ250_08370 [bacterium]|nr:hypothetical protein [bacterium]